MQLNLRYGSTFVTLRIPRRNINAIIQPWQNEKGPDNAQIVRQALASEEKDDFQKEIAGKRLCVLLSDGTRDMPLDDIFAQLFPLLSECSQVLFLICTGTHNADSPVNSEIKKKIKSAASEAQITDFQIHTHDCKADNLIDAGRTSYGTQVTFNAKADQARLFLVLSDVKCHYFAGYSNPVKNFVPGICAFTTAEQNHRLALDENSTFGLHPWHKDPGRRVNPLAADQLEGMKLIVKNRPVYAMLTISTSGKIQWSRFGAVETTCTEAFDLVDRMNTHTVTPADYLIVSPGGLPNDVSFYIAQRALELTKAAVKNGGRILLIAACTNGVGEKLTTENFYNLLTAPIPGIIKAVESEYKLFMHKPYKLVRLIQRLSGIWIYSAIPDDVVEKIHLHPAHHPQQLLDDWLAQQPHAKITIADGANRLAFYAK